MITFFDSLYPRDSDSRVLVPLASPAADVGKTDQSAAEITTEHLSVPVMTLDEHFLDILYLPAVVVVMSSQEHLIQLGFAEPFEEEDWDNEELDGVRFHSKVGGKPVLPLPFLRYRNFSFHIHLYFGAGDEVSYFAW